MNIQDFIATFKLKMSERIEDEEFVNSRCVKLERLFNTMTEEDAAKAIAVADIDKEVNKIVRAYEAMHREPDNKPISDSGRFENERKSSLKPVQNFEEENRDQIDAGETRAIPAAVDGSGASDKNQEESAGYSQKDNDEHTRVYAPVAGKIPDIYAVSDKAGNEAVAALENAEFEEASENEEAYNEYEDPSDSETEDNRKYYPAPVEIASAAKKKNVTVRYQKESDTDVRYEDDDEDENGYEYVEKIPFSAGYAAFVILSAPILLPIMAAVAVLFGAVYAVCAVLIVALLITLVGLIFCGVIVSLAGIIYGVTKIFESLPVGLFEIGLGVTIGGAVMLSGILIYNVAIRFLPFVIRNLGPVFTGVFGKFKEFYLFVKRKCAKI